MDSLKRELLLYARFKLEFDALIVSLDNDESGLPYSCKTQESLRVFRNVLSLQRDKIAVCGGYIADVIAEQAITYSNDPFTSDSLKFLIRRANEKLAASFPYGAELILRETDEGSRLVVYTNSKLVSKVLGVLNEFSTFKNLIEAKDFHGIIKNAQQIAGLMTTEDMVAFMSDCLGISNKPSAASPGIQRKKDDYSPGMK